MDKIISILSNPIVWGILIFVCGIIIRSKLVSYLKIIYLLTEAIEIVDKEIKDILPPETEKKLIKIKAWICARVEKSEGKVLNDVLTDQGFSAGKKTICKSNFTVARRKESKKADGQGQGNN